MRAPDERYNESDAGGMYRLRPQFLRTSTPVLRDGPDPSNDPLPHLAINTPHLAINA